jgi:hypothetical protein
VNPDLARRILKFPTDVREALAGVPGPGWVCFRRVDGGVMPVLRLWAPKRIKDHEAWWPANPAAAVAAICVLPGGLDLQVARELLAMRMGDTAEDDHTTAVSLIEERLGGS